MRHWREPAVPAGWTFDKAQGGGYEISPFDGYCAWYVTATGEPGFRVCGKKGVRIWYGAGEAAWHNGTSVHETRVVAGRPASVIYNKHAYLFPPDTVGPRRSIHTVEYTIYGRDSSLRGGNVDAVDRDRRKPLRTPQRPRRFRLHHLDPTGQATTPGSYAFLDDAGDPPITTYEGLRDGTTTGLRIHQSRSVRGLTGRHLRRRGRGGPLRVAQGQRLLRALRGLPKSRRDPAGTAPRKELAIEWMTYAFTGCSGAISSTATASVRNWGPLPDLGGPSLTAPVRCTSPFQIVPEDWTGERMPGTRHDPPAYNRDNERSTSDLAVARTFPYWREPALPDHWVLAYARMDAEDLPYGYLSHLV